MKLELTEKKAKERQFEQPVLFIHGAGFSAGCWGGFLDYFAEAGCDAYAMSLRGHGNSGPDGSVVLTGAGHYIEDIRSVVEQIDGEPVLVGHSWGGYLLQRYLERYHDGERAVLMASAPPSTSAPAYWKMFKKFPWLVTVAHLTARPHFVYNTTKSVRELLYYPDASESDIQGYKDGMERISTLLYLQTIFRPPRPERIQTQMMVIGGGDDKIYDSAMISETAQVYGVDPVVIPGMCHMMMNDPAWQTAADRVLEWLKESG